MIPLQKLGLTDEFFMLGRGLGQAFRKGKPLEFFKSQPNGFLGGGALGLFAGKQAKGYSKWAAVKGAAKGSWSGGKNMFSTGWNWSYGPMWPLTFSLAAYSASQAPRGDKAGTLVGTLAGDYMGATIGAALFGVPGAFAGNLLGHHIGERVTALAHDSQSYLQNRRSLDFGNFHDFRAARTMRQVAAAEMSTSLLNARAYLGQEGVALHS